MTWPKLTSPTVPGTWEPCRATRASALPVARKSDCSLPSFASGADVVAFAELSEHPPDYVFIDYELPSPSGGAESREAIGALETTRPGLS